MSSIKICKRCLYPSNHPFGLTFIGEICSGCYVHEEKYRINWSRRFSDLLEIIESTKSTNKRNSSFDCIIPITGGGDTYFTIDFVKNRLGLNPLLVHYNNHFNTPVGIRNISNIANTFNCDLVSAVPAPGLIKEISKITLNHFGNFYWQAIAGHLTFPVQTAVKYNIPLIIWGVNGWMDQVGMYSHLDSVQMSQRCREEHGLQGITINDILKYSSKLNYRDLNGFIYPENNKIAKLNLKGIYLNNYIFWDSKVQNENMIRNNKYEVRLMERTFNNYEDVGCLFANGTNDLLRYYKYGFSKVSDHAAREIRLNRMTIETAKNYILEYSVKMPSDVEELSNWLNISKDKLQKIVLSFKNNDNFDNLDSIESKFLKELRKINLTDYSEFGLINQDNNIEYIVTDNREYINESQLIMIGRDYSDKYNYGAIIDTPEGAGKLI
jgi:N-acetyl sugar amidotransferase